MTEMHFLVGLQEFLNQYRVIYTVRRYLYEPDNKVVFIPGVGACRRTLVSKVPTDEGSARVLLTLYATESGLDTFEAWWDKIWKINKNYQGTELYLYKVVKIR